MNLRSIRVYTFIQMGLLAEFEKYSLKNLCKTAKKRQKCKKGQNFKKRQKMHVQFQKSCKKTKKGKNAFSISKFRQKRQQWKNESTFFGISVPFFAFLISKFIKKKHFYFFFKLRHLVALTCCSTRFHLKS